MRQTMRPRRSTALLIPILATFLVSQPVEAQLQRQPAPAEAIPDSEPAAREADAADDGDDAGKGDAGKGDTAPATGDDATRARADGDAQPAKTDAEPAKTNETADSEPAPAADRAGNGAPGQNPAAAPASGPPRSAPHAAPRAAQADRATPPDPFARRVDDRQVAVPHPLSKNFPNEDIVVCEAGCGPAQPLIVYRQPRATVSVDGERSAPATTAKMVTADATLVPTAASATTSTAPSAAKTPPADAAPAPAPQAANPPPPVVPACVAGCYHQPAPSFRAAALATAAHEAADATAGQWLSNAEPPAPRPKPKAAARKPRAVGKKPGKSASGEWLTRIERDRAARKTWAY